MSGKFVPPIIMGGFFLVLHKWEIRKRSVLFLRCYGMPQLLEIFREVSSAAWAEGEDDCCP